MTIQANQGFGVSIFGAVSGGGGGSTSPGGSSGQVQYNNGGSFGGMSGTTWTDASQSLAIASTGTGTGVTTSQPVLNLSQTWNASGVTFTGLKFNATDTLSASGSLLLDLQVGGTSQFNVSKDGNVSAGTSSVQASITAGYFITRNLANVGVYIRSNETSAGIRFGTADDLILRRAAAATLQLGAADAAAPVAQTLQVQSVVAGTTNTAGTNFTINGSRGTGTGAGGSIIFQVAPAGSTGSAQNAYSTALTINGAQQLVLGSAGSASAPAINGGTTITNGATSGIYWSGNGQMNFSSYTGGVMRIGSAAAVQLTDTAEFGWGSLSGTSDVKLFRDATGPALALRNGTSAQRFNVYNTYTSSTNYETFKIDWITTANTCLIGTEKGSSGTARALALQTDGTTRLTIAATSGNVTITGQVSASGTTAVGDIGGRSGVQVTGNGSLAIATGGNFLFRDWGSNEFYLTASGTAIIQLGQSNAATAIAQTLRVQSGTGTNSAGATWTRIGSLGTGTAAAGNIVEQTGFSGSSGTTAHTAVDREIIVAQGKTLTDNTATSLFEIALPTLAMAGGVIEATVICTDGTDMQAVTETITYAAVNKGGVYTKDVDVQTTSSAVSAGTITNTWAFLDGTNKVTMQVTSDTSLTPTKFLVYYKVRNNSEQATTIL